MTPKPPPDVGPWHRLLPGGPARRGVAASVGYYGLCLVPALTAAGFGTVRPWWMLSTLALALTVLRLYERRGPARVAALAVGALAAFANLLLMVSLYVQGIGFNVQFFYHFDWVTVAAAWDAFTAPSVLAGAYWLLVCLWPGLLPDRPAPTPFPRAWLQLTVVIAIYTAAVLNTALLSAAWHIGAGLVRAQRIVLVPKPRTPFLPGPRPASPRNLVVVIAESLEATYARTDLFGVDLTPALTALAADAVRFTDMRQVSHTGWTTGALVAASCAVPMAATSYWRQATGTVNARMPDAVCLGDVLAAHGYRTVFMGGAPLWFADKGSFLAAHGFAERHGYDDLAPQLPDPDYRSGWGIHDDELLALARSRLAELAADDRPFALVVLTLDTHFPPGYPSASCGAVDNSDRAATVRCADRLVAGFIADVRGAVPEAVVVLYSDHLSQESPSRAGLLAEGAELHATSGMQSVARLVDRPPEPGVRRLRFAIWDRGLDASVVNRPGTHFDIMPTVLDALGFAGWRVHAFGASLFRTASPWLAHPDPNALRLVHDIADIVLPHDGRVTFDARGPTMEIGGQRILPTGRGLALDDAVFAVAFAPDGHALRVVDTQAFEAMLAQPGPSPLLVGISSRRDINRQLLRWQPPPLAYFAGRPGRDLAAGRLALRDGPQTVRVRRDP